MNSAIINVNASRSEQLLMLSDQAMLLFMLCWPHCDDYGRIKASPGHWALTVCPGRYSAKEVQGYLQELADARDEKGDALLTPYTVGNERFFYVTKWFKHQSFNAKYTMRARCPHPVTETVEPNVTARVVYDFFKERLTSYNTLGEEVREFWSRPKNRAENSGKEGANSGKTETGGAKDSPEIPNDSGKVKENSGPLPEGFRKNGPSSSSASSQSSSSASSPDNDDDDSARKRLEAGLGGGGEPPPPENPLVNLALAHIGRVPKFEGLTVDVARLEAGLGLVRRVAPDDDAIARQFGVWEAENTGGKLKDAAGRDPVGALLSWLERAQRDWQNAPKAIPKVSAMPDVLGRKKPEAGRDYWYLDPEGTGNARMFFYGTDEPWDEKAWRERQR